MHPKCSNCKAHITPDDGDLGPDGLPWCAECLDRHTEADS